MTRLRGWAPKGERLVDKVPHGHWKTATFLAALRNDRIDAPCLYDGPINGEPVRDRARMTDPVGMHDEIYVFQALSGG
jgi:hypothetical protein